MQILLHAGGRMFLWQVRTDFTWHFTWILSWCSEVPALSVRFKWLLDIITTQCIISYHCYHRKLLRLIPSPSLRLIPSSSSHSVDELPLWSPHKGSTDRSEFINKSTLSLSNLWMLGSMSLVVIELTSVFSNCCRNKKRGLG